jgi:hypothetical protein
MVSKPLKKKRSIEYYLKEIKEKSYFIDENIDFKPRDLLIGFSLELSIDTESDDFLLIPTITYLNDKDKKEILKISIENKFKVKNVKQFETKTKKGEDIIDIPDEFLQFLLTTTFDHTRAIISKNTVGTKLENHLLPFISIPEFIKNIKSAPQVVKESR